MRVSRQGSALAVSHPGAEAHISSGPTIKRKGSFRSLLTCFFKSSKQGRKTHKVGSTGSGDASVKTARLLPRLRSSLSTISLPIKVRASTPSVASPHRSEYDNEEGSNNSRPLAENGLSRKAQSTTSLPSQIRPPFVSHAPSSSSSSASSLEFVCDDSTAATSPSNSSPSVLMKSPSSQSISTLDHSTSSLSSEKSREPSPPRAQSPAGMPKKPKRTPENYSKQPSPLSTVTDAHSPYTNPTTPESSSGRPSDSRSKRRGSLGSFILRRTQSHPDLTDLTTDDLPLFPQMPISTPPSRPVSSSSILSPRSLTLRRKSSKIGPHGPTSYSLEEKLEHRSILGADPAGGFHLYPSAHPARERPGRRSTSNSPRPTMHGRPPTTRGTNEDLKRNSWAGSEIYSGRSGMAPPAPRGWKDPRSRGFRRGVTQQVIMEEAGDIPEQPQEVSSPASQCGRRRSDGFNQQQHQSSRGVVPRNLAEHSMRSVSLGLVNTTGRSSDKSSEKGYHKQSLHNGWNSIQEPVEFHQNGHLQVPTVTKKFGEEDCGFDEDLVLKRLQQGALRFMDSSDENKHGSYGEPLTVNFSHPNKAPGHVDRLPAIRIESV